jgi:hypothetical protein
MGAMTPSSPGGNTTVSDIVPSLSSMPAQSGCRDAGLTFGEQKKNIGYHQSTRNNVMHPRSQPSEKGADELEVAVDEAIAACGGDMRSTIRALIVANEYLESEACELMAAVSHAYVRGRFRTYSG